MAVKLRLTRVGSKKNPIYRVVAADSRSPRDGKFLETIGTWDPRAGEGKLVLDRVRYAHWLKLGARPSELVGKLVVKHPEAPAAAASA